MLLSACAGTDKDVKKPVVVAAKPAAKAPLPEEPILPKLKPKTQKRKPASPKLTDDDAAGAPADQAPAADTHQQLISDQGAASLPPSEENPTTEPLESDGASAQSAALPPPSVVPAEPEPVPAWGNPDELKSKAESEVSKLLGRPISVRREGTGTIWTYRAGTCSLDVYFFLDVADNQRRALSYEFSPEGADDAAVSSCYKVLKEASHAP